VADPKCSIIIVHDETINDALNPSEIEGHVGTSGKEVDLLHGSDYYYFFENKARDIINRFKKSGIQRPRHVTFILQAQ